MAISAGGLPRIGLLNHEPQSVYGYRAGNATSYDAMHWHRLCRQWLAKLVGPISPGIWEKVVSLLCR